MERGQRLINLYSKKIEEGSIFLEKEDEEINRFDLLDL